MDTDIEFVSSEMVGFYADTVQSELLKLKTPEGKQDIALFECLGSLQKELFKEDSSIKNVDDLSKFLRGHLSGTAYSEAVETFCSKIKSDEQSYLQFYQENEAEVRKLKETLGAVQSDPEKGYDKDFSALYNFFNVDRKSKCFGFIAPVREKKIDGQAYKSGFMTCYETKKEENEEYINDSLLLKRKLTTPFHEGTHVLFSRSDMWQEICQTTKALFDEHSKENTEAEKDGVEKLLSVLKEYFENNKQAMNNRIKDVKMNCLAAIQEAFAASSSMRLKGHYGTTDDQFYYGFEGANKLAKCTYPLYNEYLDAGRQLDDQFFERLADAFGGKDPKQKDKQAEEEASAKPVEDLAENKLGDKTKNGAKEETMSDRLAEIGTLVKKETTEKSSVLNTVRLIHKNILTPEK